MIGRCDVAVSARSASQTAIPSRPGSIRSRITRSAGSLRRCRKRRARSRAEPWCARRSADSERSVRRCRDRLRRRGCGPLKREQMSHSEDIRIVSLSAGPHKYQQIGLFLRSSAGIRLGIPGRIRGGERDERNPDEVAVGRRCGWRADLHVWLRRGAEHRGRARAGGSSAGRRVRRWW